MKPTLGPQQELILEERTLVRPTGNIFEGLKDGILRIFRKQPTPLEEGIRRVLAMTPEEYQAVIWSRGGHRVKQALMDAGYHDAQVPGCRLCPPWRKGAPE